ncbi:MAG: protein adenylyltransferase SelO [Burkholderiaceae bacterium]
MNGPAQFTPPSLPPLSAYPPSGVVPQCSPESLGLKPEAWQKGLGQLVPQGLGLACDPTPLDRAEWVSVSSRAASLLGLTPDELLQQPAWLALLSGQQTVQGHAAYASVYAGHQFGVFVPRLGDGRALNLGMLNGWELQLKGAGPTPYARHADGRAVLRSSIREYLCSEFMAALGVPTTRALSLVSAATPVFRETTETAAVVCRLAPSFVRFGHFEYLASQQQPALLQELVDHLVQTQPNFEALRGQPSGASRNRAFFEQVADQTAALMAHWTVQGFMHGVMNTDNFSILGLTIDYGPYGWMEHFAVHHICNHSDHQGRYAYSQQPSIGLWNLQRLLVALSSVDLGEPIQAINERLIESYEKTFQQTYQTGMARRLGLPSEQTEALASLLQNLYPLLTSVDYPRFMRAMAEIDPRENPQDPAGLLKGYGPLVDEMLDREALARWLVDYRQLWLADHGAQADLASWQATVRQANPAFVLRNWVAQEIIQAAQEGDWSGLHDGLRIFTNPFDEHLDLPHRQHWRQSPPDWAHHLEVSCSS